MKIKDIQKKYLPVWAIVPLLSILAVNCVVYWGADALTASRYHYDFTTGFDRAVPLIPESSFWKMYNLFLDSPDICP